MSRIGEITIEQGATAEREIVDQRDDSEIDFAETLSQVADAGKHEPARRERSRRAEEEALALAWTPAVQALPDTTTEAQGGGGSSDHGSIAVDPSAAAAERPGTVEARGAGENDKTDGDAEAASASEPESSEARGTDDGERSSGAASPERAGAAGHERAQGEERRGHGQAEVSAPEVSNERPIAALAREPQGTRGMESAAGMSIETTGGARAIAGGAQRASGSGDGIDQVRGASNQTAIREPQIDAAAGSGTSEAAGEGVGDAAAEDSEEEQAGGRAVTFGEALFHHIAEAASELATHEPKQGESVARQPHHATAPGEQTLHHAHIRNAHAEFTLGEGADRISLVVNLDHHGVQVHAQVASVAAAATLLGSTGELRKALERHGLALAGFSAGDGSSAGNGGGAEHEAAHRGSGTRAATASVSSAAEARVGRRGVRVIV